MNLTTIISQANNFLMNAFQTLEKHDFKLETHWHIDHLCYRTSTNENYNKIKDNFSKIFNLLIESEINGRMISTFKLQTPIHFQSWEIDLIELIAPKVGKMTKDGFEHFEVVCDETFDQIKSRFHQWKFNEQGLEKDFNQELELTFDQFSLKFHHLSLESVVNLEMNKFVFATLKNSNVLKLLKPFNPLIAGTFPLKVNVPGSDLDILVSFNDLEFAKKYLNEKLGHFQTFKLNEIVVQGEITLLLTFIHQGTEFEVFGQKTQSVRQQGYLHFLIEERLLKLGGISFRDKVQYQRHLGLKTEHAFAAVLGISEDPYGELLNLQKRSNQELKKIINKKSF